MSRKHMHAHSLHTDSSPPSTSISERQAQCKFTGAQVGGLARRRALVVCSVSPSLSLRECAVEFVARRVSCAIAHVRTSACAFVRACVCVCASRRASRCRLAGGSMKAPARTKTRTHTLLGEGAVRCADGATAFVAATTSCADGCNNGAWSLFSPRPLSRPVARRCVASRARHRRHHIMHRRENTAACDCVWVCHMLVCMCAQHGVSARLTEHEGRRGARADSARGSAA